MLRFAATIFLSAFLLFLVQPLIGKYILPWFGGGAGVWTACLLFFQCALLAGYLYAHALVTWLTPWRQMLGHLSLLVGAIALLPIIPREAFKPEDSSQPVLGIVTLLVATIGVPYLALSATGPLLQAWHARSTQLGERSTYRLFALSNLASLLALLGYPFLIEPFVSRHAQAMAWSGGFAVFAALCAWCAIAQARGTKVAAAASAPTIEPSPLPSPLPERRGRTTVDRQGRGGTTVLTPAPKLPRRITRLDRVLWVLLPMCATVMLMAATTQISDEIAPVPFVWVVPLAAYLITFIIAFEWPLLYDRRVFVPLAVAAPWLFLAILIDRVAGIALQGSLYLSVMFACCMICHGEVYRLRPDSSRLTGYYLAVAFGGALGGVFVTVIAPLIFDFNLEIHLALFGSIAVLGVCLTRDAMSPFFRGANRQAWLGLMLVIALAGFLISRSMRTQYGQSTLLARSFYGSLNVRDSGDFERGTALRKLFHGRTSHGSQSLIPQNRYLPLTYYTPSSGVGMVMRLMPRHGGGRRVGVLGLGAGSLAAWGESGDTIRFYEIDPLIIDIARTQFTLVQDSRATVEIVQGDGRLSMERESPQNYDIIVLDAFSGDAVPLHLLTREAFAVYRRHLRDGGVIAVNVSNRYLDLQPIVRRHGLDAGMNAALIKTAATDPVLTSNAHWVILTTDGAFLSLPEIAAANALTSSDDARDAELWTDDYCSLLRALKHRQWAP